ncbi:gamma-glutamyltransferase [uncultured Paludibaculum sp.]|uniref:gamma-glutamyltransferase family protein n=1 Tax=uncultured Paludibaculum sp. TaxID=1765020 RepID=UPI002AABE1E9|nr:gamma-glutamyltransferase [uncultured Paludibaculum sp.]
MLKNLLVVFAAWTALLPAQRATIPVRYPARGLHGAVAAGSDYATEAGLRILHMGGNAVDAGVAATLAAAVTEYSHFGFGGEAPILIRTAQGKVYAIAGVGTMPKAATFDYFLRRKLKPEEIYEIEENGLDHMLPTAGLHAALVPGMVDAVLVALQEFGSLTFAQVAQPAFEFAQSAPIDEPRVREIQATRHILSLWPTSKAVFLPEGRVPRPGDVFRQPDLARTIQSMMAAEKGPSRKQAIEAVRNFFYRGDIARRIAAFSQANGGLLRYEDFAAFHLAPEEPVAGTYHGYTVYKPGFWSQGPSMIEALNILGLQDLSRFGWNSPEYIHTSVEALKLAYADRDTWYGDPKFTPEPRELLTLDYARQRAQLIGPRASAEFRPGLLNGKAGDHPSSHAGKVANIDDALMNRDTTCVTAADKEGLVFASTPSGAWTPAVIAGDTGIPLTQRAQSFLLIAGHPNAVAGGKRPRVTLSPTLVTYQGKPYLAMATPGGDNQDQSLLQVMLDILDFGMNPQQAVEAARYQTRHLVSSFDNHAMSPADLILDDRMGATTQRELQQRGHRVEVHSRYGSGAAPVAIRIRPDGVIEAGADPYGYRSAVAW